MTVCFEGLSLEDTSHIRIDPTHGSDRPRGLALPAQWWRETVPAWGSVSAEQFRSHRWQMRNAVTQPEQLRELVGDRAPAEFYDDVAEGLRRAPMNIRVTPHVISLVDWQNPTDDPIRRQFIPLGSEIEPDHPMCTLDALHEQDDAVAPGLTHRYPDKALFLCLDVCPVYCRFCTRSYAIGSDTDSVEKVSVRGTPRRWEQVFEYLRAHPEVEDVVVSGGDTCLLSPERTRLIGEALLDIPSVRRFRFATKGLAVIPQRFLPGSEWVQSVTDLVEKGRQRGVDICIHTHFNHPNEVAPHAAEAALALFQRGVVVRNQTVLQRGVNDHAGTLVDLHRFLSRINVHPYYVYVHDMVPGVETLRTSLADAIELEKDVRGATAGYNTPMFVVDAYGGGGKRDAHGFEHYDSDLGIAVYRAPTVDPDRPFFYFDPLRRLSDRVKRAWNRTATREAMIQTAVERAGMGWAS